MNSTERQTPAPPGSLDFRVIPDHDHAGLDAIGRAVARGFLSGEPTDAALEARHEAARGRRHIGVFDSSLPHPEIPVATIGSWVTTLSTPGGSTPMRAISVVTVAPTHRRRGIARTMLERELRDAAEAGIAVAGLTASEATIYGRYGFGIATVKHSLTVDARRAGWVGPEGTGRVEFVEREELAVAIAVVHAAGVRDRPGDVDGWNQRWREFAGVAPGEDQPERVRGVRYVDAAGTSRGAMAYRVTEPESGPVRLDVRFLTATTAEAEAALWKFALQYDLVDQVTASQRPVDDPLPWLVADPRAVTAEPVDDEWLRILDVPAALTARTYAAPASVVLDVSDPLGYAAGSWRVDIDGSGSATVTQVDAAAGAEDLPRLELGVAELSSMYLGGVSARTLYDAGRLRGPESGARALAAALQTWRAPFLSINY